MIGLFFFLLTLLPVQETKPWNNKSCAVVLTYDDASNVHLDNVIPLLDSLKLKGSFYLSGYFPGFRDRVSDWRKAAINGHELANHTLFHPCIGNTPGREWVKPERKMENYSILRMTEEVRMNNILLTAVDGKTKRTFAYPCGDMKIRDSLYLDKKDFVAARSTREQMPQITEIDLYDIGCYSMNGQSGEEMITLVKKAMSNHGLLVFLFHGVGGEHSLNVSLPEHRKLLRFLKQNEKDIWIAPLMDVVERVKRYQSQKR